MPGSDEIEYQGRKIKLSRPYSDYEEYKSDPRNLARTDKEHIERLVSEAPMELLYESRNQMIRAVFALKFPGYGLSCFGEKQQPDGSVLDGYGVEIPRARKDRIIVFRGDKGVYTRIDDFVFSSRKEIMEVREEGEELVYYTRNGERVTAHKPGLR